MRSKRCSFVTILACFLAQFVFESCVDVQNEIDVFGAYLVTEGKSITTYEDQAIETNLKDGVVLVSQNYNMIYSLACVGVMNSDGYVDCTNSRYIINSLFGYIEYYVNEGHFEFLEDLLHVNLQVTVRIVQADEYVDLSYDALAKKTYENPYFGAEVLNPNLLESLGNVLINK